MSAHDEWGHDPSVQMMRRVFSLMEKAQAEMMEQLSISPFDPRLQRIRSRARDFFEETWPIAMRKEIVSNDQETIRLYLCCLKHVLKLNGFPISDQTLFKDERLEEFLKESLR